MPVWVSLMFIHTGSLIHALVDVGSDPNLPQSRQQRSVTCSRWETKYWPIRSHVTNTVNVPASLEGLSWPHTNLGREDVVADIPDPFASVHVGVTHSFHFAVDGAHCRVCGLVSFLVDKHPPVKKEKKEKRKKSESILSGVSTRYGATVKAANHLTTPTGKDMYSGFVSILHSNSTCQQHTSRRMWRDCGCGLLQCTDTYNIYS